MWFQQITCPESGVGSVKLQLIAEVKLRESSYTSSLQLSGIVVVPTDYNVANLSILSDCERNHRYDLTTLSYSEAENIRRVLW